LGSAHVKYGVWPGPKIVRHFSEVRPKTPRYLLEFFQSIFTLKTQVLMKVTAFYSL